MKFFITRSYLIGFAFHALLISWFALSEQIPISLIYDHKVDYNVKRKIYEINKNLFKDSVAIPYIQSGNYVTEEEADSYLKSQSDCYFDSDKFIDYLNILRDKHNVSVIQWDKDWENNAKIYINALLQSNDPPVPYFYTPRLMPSELHVSGAERLTEIQWWHKWYDIIYEYDFNKKTFHFDRVNYYPLAVLLFNSTQNVGCAKGCYDSGEIYICDFSPPLLKVTLDDIGKYIHKSKYKSG